MSFELTSTAFDHGESIPRRHGYKDANVNPPLDIHEVPEDAVSLAVVVDDPDAVGAAGKVWDHWVVWNVPVDTSHIPADWDSGRVIEGRNDYGEQGYGGPNPPDRQHTYRFRAYALDDTLDLDAGATKDELESAMEGHVIADATLEGTYAP